MLYVYFIKFKMDSFEINKIIAAILVTVLIVFGVNKISDLLFIVKKPEIKGYKVEVKVGDATATLANVSSNINISELLALGTLEQGKKVFKKCAACHSIKKDGKNKIGPALYSIVNKSVASVPNYKYSKALSSYGKKWSFEELNGFLLKPSAWIKGNKMGFAGLKKDEDRASIIIYLNENSDNPAPLP